MLGAQWLADVHRLAIFEGQDSRLAILDSVGKTIRTIGRQGEGPAEFRLSPVYIGSRQKFRFAADGRAFVLDDRFGHVFTDTGQIQEIRIGARPQGLVTDAHVARIRRGWIVSQGQRLSADPTARSLVRLFLVPDTSANKIIPTSLGTLRNPQWIVPAGPGPFADGPYGNLYRRTWDADGSHLAMLSYKRFAVCLGSPSALETWRAWSIPLSPRRVDGLERERILRQRFGRATGLAPMMNVPVERIYEGKWPEHAPFYYDVTALSESTFAALRLDVAKGVAVDFIHSTQGFVGTLKVPEKRYVMGGYLNGLLLLDPDEGTIEFLRVHLK